ncbi:MAG: ribonuclease R family protein [Acidobacteriota bacterium]
METPSFYLSDREVLERIQRLPHSRASFKNLVRELSARGDQREALEQALLRLTTKGELIEFRTGQYVAAKGSREFATGRLNMHRDGYGFVTPAHKIEGLAGDIVIPAKHAAAAMHGDRVLVQIGFIGRDGKADGEILQVLGRAHATVVGEFRVRHRGNWVKPHDDRIHQWLFIPDGYEIPRSAAADRTGPALREYRTAEDLNGAIVDVEVLEFPTEHEDGIGRVIEVLGREGDFGLDVEITIRKHHLPHTFPHSVLAQARAIPAEIPAAEIARRRDYRHLPIVTIDGETARDFDDAIYVEPLPNGHWKLDVHIADVSHYVQPGSPIDKEALFRGTSVYFPDRAVPMLPHELSTNLCSLVPQQDRLVLSAELELDRSGDVVAQSFHRGVIRSTARMTYTAVHKILGGDEVERTRYAALVPHFENMQELALILNRKRVKRGSIDFDLPEPLIEFDEHGFMVGVTRAPRNIAHRLIEEFMLAANEAVAAHIEAAGIPGIYRIHETPDFKKVSEFEEVAAQFGYSLGFPALPVKKHKVVERRRDGRKERRDLVLADERIQVTSRAYQKLIARLEGTAEERILSFLMLRSLKQARYSHDNVGHFALASGTYTHFTSPIRRYPDLMVHRILGGLFDGQGAVWSEPQLEEIANDCSFTERRAAEAERELVEWKKVQFMIDRVGDEFDGVIISITRFGMFVELTDLFIEGLLPIDALPGERFRFLEGARRLIGEKTRREFSIGDAIRVVLDRVDGVERRLTFSLWQHRPPRQKKKKKY